MCDGLLVLLLFPCGGRWEDAPEWLTTVNLNPRAAGDFKPVDWPTSIFSKPAGWA